MQIVPTRELSSIAKYSPELSCSGLPQNLLIIKGPLLIWEQVRHEGLRRGSLRALSDCGLLGSRVQKPWALGVRRYGVSGFKGVWFKGLGLPGHG